MCWGVVRILRGVWPAVYPVLLGVSSDSGWTWPDDLLVLSPAVTLWPFTLLKTFRRRFPHSEPGVPELAGNVGMNRPVPDHDLESGGD